MKVQWANSKPYLITINNSARTYEEQLAEYEKRQQAFGSQSITIGNNNKIKNSTITGNIYNIDKPKSNGFYEKHPLVCGFLISLIAGIVLLFSFWDRIITFVEGLF